MTLFFIVNKTQEICFFEEEVSSEKYFLICWKERDSAGTNLPPFYLVVNTDVMSGGAWPSCDKKVMAHERKRREQPPSH